jgi:hypothetical protein
MIENWSWIDVLLGLYLGGAFTTFLFGESGFRYTNDKKVYALMLMFSVVTWPLMIWFLRSVGNPKK